MQPPAKEAGLSPLVLTYLEKREALLRFFSVRLGSATAAEDLVQDIYLKVSSLPADLEVQNRAAFLYRLGSNLLLDRLRQQRRSAVRDTVWRAHTTTVLAGEAIAEEPAGERVIDARQRVERVLEALQELPPQPREAFRLHKLEGASQAEVAEALGVSRSSVEKYISAALKHLMARLRP